MNLLSISQVSKTYDLKPVLRGVTVAVDAGERIGVIGANGAGKSTLFKLISGAIAPEEGTISLRRGITTAMLAQQPQLDNTATVHNTLAASLIEVQQVINEYQAITERMAACQDEAELRLLEPEHAEIEHRMEQVGGWEFRHRIDAILGHLGIVDDSRIVGELSGGERKRVALACALIRNPDLLVLDEPTNHLDALTISWLEQYLDTYAGALLLITHDRYFLDNVVERLIEIEGGRAINYQGGYSDYLATRAERQESEARAHARLLNMLRREEEWLRRGVRARGTKSKYRVQNVAELREAARREAVTRLETQLKTTKRLGNTILEVEGLTKVQGQLALVKDLDFILVRGDRVALVGPNGCGKTTLLRVLMGIDAPTSGKITLGKNTHIAYFAQDRLDLNQELTVWEYISENAEMVNVRGEFRTVRSYLGDFKFPPDRLTVKIKTLSGGEKNRLVLAKLLLTDANLLVLDEPTNDLDIETLQWIEQALVDFTGCVLFVSHDRFFLDKVANSLLVFEGAGQVVRHAGNYSLYQQLAGQSERAAPTPPEQKTEPRVVEKRAPARAKLSYKEQQELTTVEARLAELEEEIGTLERQLSEPGGADHQQIAALAERYEALKGESERMYERWLELEEKRGA